MIYVAVGPFSEGMNAASGTAKAIATAAAIPSPTSRPCARPRTTSVDTTLATDAALETTTSVPTRQTASASCDVLLPLRTATMGLANGLEGAMKLRPTAALSRPSIGTSQAAILGPLKTLVSVLASERPATTACPSIDERRLRPCAEIAGLVVVTSRPARPTPRLVALALLASA